MTTPKLSFPEIAQSQSAKYVTHNDALRELDIITQPNVIRFQSSAVPVSTFVEGNSYIVVSPSAGSAWTGQDNNIAYYFNSAWAFVSSITDGHRVYNQEKKSDYVFENSNWVQAGKAVVSVNVSGGNTSVSLDMNAGNVFHVVLQANASVQFTNPPVSGNEGIVTVYFEQDATGSRTMALINTVVYASGAATTISSSATAEDIWEFRTINAGSKWYGIVRGKNF